MNADPEEMVQELTLHHKSLQDRLFDRQGERLPIDKVDLGAKFTHELNSYADASSTGKVNEMRQRCSEMLTEALNQVEKRLPKSTSAKVHCHL